jgi:hypothetical protein
MTVQPAEASPPEEPEPDVSEPNLSGPGADDQGTDGACAQVPQSAAGIFAWAVFSGALVAVYLIAFAHHSIACQKAAGFGLAISLGVAVPVFLVALDRADSRLTLKLSDMPARGAVSGLMLIATVTVIWVALNLTVANQPTGAWALTVVASAAPLALLVRPARRVPETPAEPPKEVIEQIRLAEQAALRAAESARSAAQERALAEMAKVKAGDWLAAAQLATTAQQAEAARLAEAEASRLDEMEIARLAEETRQDNQARLAEAARAKEARRAEAARLAEEARVAEKARRHVVRVLDPRWASRLGSPPPTVALDAAFWEMVIRELAGRRAEQGGVALMVRSDNVLIVFGAVFPAQMQATPVYCEFSTDDVIRVRRALDEVAPRIGLQPGDVTVTWVHTHPYMGPFLSATDQETARAWRALDPHFTPIVIDANGPHLERQIGVFDSTGRQIEPMGVVRGLVNESVTPQIIGALQHTYRDEGLPEPLVLIPGSGEGKRGGRSAEGRDSRRNAAPR